MVTIKKIEITGFFGRGNFVWNLDSVVNILGGKNGSGKTTIFRFCYSLLSGSLFDVAQHEYFSNLFEGAELTFSNTWRLLWKKIPKEDVDYSKKIELESIVVLDEHGVKRNYEDLKNEFQVFYLNSFEQRLSQALQYAKQPSVQALDDPMLLDLMIQDQINIRNGYISKVVDSVAKLTISDAKKKLESLFFSYQKIFDAAGIFFDDYGRIGVDFNFDRAGVEIGFERLSAGEKQILLLLLMVDNASRLGCIFFMDEPDLSMHIDWKEKLVRELHQLNPNMQMILCTHAPSVITKWRENVREVSQLIE